MTCPACASAMTALDLEGQYGRRIEVDLCANCTGIWLDGMESHQLTPGATLTLFRHLAKSTAQAHVPSQARKPCPRCGLRLSAVIDRQGSTSFELCKCPRGHGRYMTAVAFLRAKNFVRDLTPAEIDDVRRHVRILKCANCGANVDISTTSTCSYCQTPFVMLDPVQMQKTLDSLDTAATERHAIDSSLQLDMAQRFLAGRVFAALGERREGDSSGDVASSLVDTGLRLLAGLVGRSTGRDD